VRGEVRGRKLELRMLRMKGDLFTVVIVVGGMLLGMFAGRNTRDICSIILYVQLLGSLSAGELCVFLVQR